jgi:transcriptional regulator with XRE-family HTH domain
MSKIKELIKNSGISQASLAKKLGISRQQLYSILKDNRKTKYSNQITNLLNNELTNKENISTSENKTDTSIEKLPIVYPEDILRITDGLQALNSLYKPFYNQWSFITADLSNKNHFCMRITDDFNLKNEIALGAFRFYIPLQHENGKYFLVFLHESNKIIMGFLKIDPKTKSKSIVNNNRSYQITAKDLILAECTQIVLYL